MRKLLVIARLIVVALAGFMLLGVGSCRRDLNPIIFVHGGSGSGAQFESQAMRFASNGYPQSYLAVVEYDSGGLDFPEDLPIVHAEIDARIAELQAATGRAQVDLMGHSRGTTVSHDYLSFPERAANVAHYVNIDGRSADAPPGGVPTLALWAGAVDRPVEGEIVGAINVTVPNQEHIEVATSEESFFEMYHFLRGHAPLTTKILPQLLPRISGRVVLFPDNVGRDGATLEVWRVDGDTGERVMTGDQGNYVFPQVRPGEYTLVFTKSGYAQEVESGVLVEAGRQTEVDLSLLGEYTEMEEFLVQDVLAVAAGTEARTWAAAWAHGAWRSARSGRANASAALDAVGPESESVFVCPPSPACAGYGG